MNQLFTKKMKAIVFLGTMGVLSFTLTAKPVLKTIKAHLNPAISYTLEGKKVLGGAKTITYNNKIYVPLADITKIAGLQMKLENNTIVMTKSTATLPLLPAPETTTPAVITVPVTTSQGIDVKPEIKSYKNVKIAEVNNPAKYIIIQADGRQIKALFNNKTKVHYEDLKKKPNANSLKVGQTVDIKLVGSVVTSDGSGVKILEIKVKDHEIRGKGDENKGKGNANKGKGKIKR